jgi:hypothetical protein
VRNQAGPNVGEFWADIQESDREEEGQQILEQAIELPVQVRINEEKNVER